MNYSNIFIILFIYAIKTANITIKTKYLNILQIIINVIYIFLSIHVQYVSNLKNDDVIEN